MYAMVHQTPYLFLPVSPPERDDIAHEGLVVTAEVRARLTDDLEEAHAAAYRDVLVLPRERVTDSSSSAASPSIAAAEFLNLQPYAPPIRVLAAGGFVVRPGATEPEVLLIHRRNVWDLPKGKLDPDESLAQCAAREVREELGIGHVELLTDLGTTEHGYPEGGFYCVKRTHWYLMRTDAVRFVPQASEAITGVSWMTFSQAAEALGYETLRSHTKTASKMVQRYLREAPAEQVK